MARQDPGHLHRQSGCVAGVAFAMLATQHWPRDSASDQHIPTGPKCRSRPQPPRTTHTHTDIQHTHTHTHELAEKKAYGGKRRNATRGLYDKHHHKQLRLDFGPYILGLRYSPACSMKATGYVIHPRCSVQDRAGHGFPRFYLSPTNTPPTATQATCVRSSRNDACACLLVWLACLVCARGSFARQWNKLSALTSKSPGGGAARERYSPQHKYRNGPWRFRKKEDTHV